MIHGYLLGGTGSNIFVSNLVRHFCLLGHDVYLFCQEREPQTLDFISQHCVFEKGNKSHETVFSRETDLPGKCILFNPHLEGLLPVYVYDEYEGFTVKTFQEMETSEIERYIEQNAQAIETVYAENGYDVVHTNHVIMSPYIARELWKRSEVPYYITLHGSALNFSVKNDERLRPYAIKALLDAEKIFAVSRHNRLEVVTFFKEISADITDKFHVVPAGVDTDRFQVLEGSKRDSIRTLSSVLDERIIVLPNGKTTDQKESFLSDLDQTSSVEEVDGLVKEYNKRYAQGHPDKDIANTLDRIDWDRDWVLLFVGKFLWTKGIQMVISSLPIVLEQVPNVHLLLVGFGSYREELEALVYALDSGRRELFRYLVERSISQMGPGDNPTIKKPFKFLEALAGRKGVKRYFESAIDNRISQHVHFLGAMCHNELGYLLPCADGFVAPSVFPEAFGMVSIEALACGVLPIISNQTGFKEIVDLLAKSVHAINQMPRVDINEEMIFNIATNIIDNIKSGNLRSPGLKQKFRRLALDNFSWESVAMRYISNFGPR